MDESLRWFAVLGLVAVIVVLCSPFVFRHEGVVAEGTLLTEPLVAKVGFSFESPELRTEWEQERRARHDQVYSYDAGVAEAASRRTGSILAAARDVAAQGLEPAEARDALRAIDAGIAAWPDAEVDALLAFSRDESFSTAVAGTVDALYRDFIVSENPMGFLAHRQRNVARVTHEDRRPPNRDIVAETMLSHPAEVRERASRMLRDRLASLLGENRGAHDTALRLVMQVMRPNLEYDAERSRESYLRYPERDFRRQYREGDVIAGVEPGQPHRVTAAEAALSAAHVAAIRTANVARFLGHLGYVLLVFILVGYYTIKDEKDFRFTARNVLLRGLPVVLALSTSFLFIMVGVSRDILAAGIFPAGAVAMIGVLLLGARTALLLVTWSCLLYGLQADLDFAVVVVSLFGGYAAVGALRAIRERREVLSAGLLIALTNVVVILLLDYIESGASMALENAAKPVVVGAVAGFACSLIAISALPLFEVVFDVTTDLRLLELSGLEHPLLRRLEEEAPGTWQHTLNVAKLAEAAAASIGANVLLVRAGVYFHDVGKLAKPEYFTENQVTLEDKARHVTLKPQISTLIIKNHVKEGVEIARRAGLPQRITDFITEHHGTGLIQFFYQKALAQAASGQSKEIVREADYRYPGPKPRTIEAAIVMMADSVEATSTAKFAARTVREDEVQQLVRSIIADRFNDGQFDECSLTMESLTRIRESLVKTLLSRYHTRVDYPKLERPGAVAAVPVSGSALASSRK